MPNTFKFLKLFFPLLLVLLLIFLSLFYRNNYLTEVQKILLEIDTNLNVIKTNAETHISNKISDTLLVRDLFEIVKNNSDNKDSFSLTSSNFQALANQTKRYDQIRYLDLSGQEIIRINYDGLNATIVPSELLQNKKGRYYFDQTISLARDQIFISPLDLNIEQNVIEHPKDSQNVNYEIWRDSSNGLVKPMIRFGTVTQDSDGNTNGMVVLNYFGNHLLNSIDNIEKTYNYPVYVVNLDSYILKSPNKDQEWGFMYDDKKDVTFQKDYPEAWEFILANSKGNFQTSQGIFIFNTIYMGSDIKKDLKIITFIDTTILNNMKLTYIKQVSGLVVLILFVFGIFYSIYYLMNKNKERVEKENIEVREKLEKQNKELLSVKDALEKSLKQQTEYSQNLEKLNQAMVGRELKMVELKKKIEELSGSSNI